MIACFAGQLSPDIPLRLSPLRNIFLSLEDGEMNKFCHVNKQFQKLWTQVMLLQPHQLDENVWHRVHRLGGPIVTNVRLDRLTELENIPSDLRSRILQIQFRYVGGKVDGSWIPPRLVKFCSRGGPSPGFDFPVRIGWLPSLPATLLKFSFGFHVDEEDNDDAIGEAEPDAASPRHLRILRRMLKNTNGLREAEICIPDDSGAAQVQLLPPTVERLYLYHYTSTTVPRHAYPISLKHLRIEVDNEREVEMDQLELPSGLVSFHFPCMWYYPHYNSAMSQLNSSSSETLRSLTIGEGCSNFTGDLFAAVPRSVTNLIHGGEDEPEGKVENLPDTITELRLALPNEKMLRWPVKLTILSIYGDSFAQPIDNLPDTIQELELSRNYDLPVSRWPTELRTLTIRNKFLDLQSLILLSESRIRSLTISYGLGKQLIDSGSLPTCLITLILTGSPSVWNPIDARLLPTSLRSLVLDGMTQPTDDPCIIHADQRSNLCMTRTPRSWYDYFPPSRWTILSHWFAVRLRNWVRFFYRPLTHHPQ